ncbi:MAG: transcription-repair coupling factor [Candidatus Margulisbacteria bacterium]|nr:transcription-repair coupling factor [Candidatus Margulisiibacteriota bacterium]
MERISIHLKEKSYLSHQSMIRELVDMGYKRVGMVLEPGECAVRGQIIDVYPSNHTHPVRIEYFGNDIERLCSFDCHTQRSLSTLNKTQISSPEAHNSFRFLGGMEDPSTENLISDIHEGDHVVHEDCGIGVYKGLKRLSLSGREGEFLFIQYKGEDKLYVPLDQMGKIHRYSGGEFTPRINSLSDGTWQKQKSRAKKATDVLAEDIYLMQKVRQNQLGFQFGEDTLWQIDLENSFEFKETPDQNKVITEIKRDMESKKPMDRLLCGDVGYGKTEVAIRVAFKAVENRKQVAILVPTTILAQQHYRLFEKRMGKFKCQVEVLSRFKSKKERDAIIERLEKGDVDIIVGTHQLLHPDIQFKDLGLLIVDEEQRFGVTHKEKLKKKRSEVDVLTITATPIPRTLYMALTGARDLSRIETPPKFRKPVMTTVMPFSESVIIDAIEKEIKRGGQVFFVLNHIQNLSKRINALRDWMPHVQFEMAHGQMKERELENVMLSFMENQFQVLVCTTIIESGIDFPNANTIIIENVERFGLSQIHQLRGRVGRTKRQATAYLLYRQDTALKDKAIARLQAIKEYTTLGCGYKLAMKDLEIRGAGALLGNSQHGHMTHVGFELYCKLLEESVHHFSGTRKPQKAAIALLPGVSSCIPESYVSQPRERLALYKRMMAVSIPQDIDKLIAELQDRYGPIPKIVLRLLESIQGQL